MPLDKLCDIYTVDTSIFYTKEERDINIQMNKMRAEHEQKKKLHDEGEYDQQQYLDETRATNKELRALKSKLKELMSDTSQMRTLDETRLSVKNIISIFDSTLTRTLNMSYNLLNGQLIIVRVYYFDIMKSIIENGFMFNGRKYIFFTASAGQIRQKKFVAIEETAFRQNINKLTCGLNVWDINIQGGVNTNKYLAYLALTNSATDIWENFNIDKAIVVDDLETIVTGEVDFIDKDFNITRKIMDIPINHTDGCGMICRTGGVYDNFMVRGPWIKGLLSPFDFQDFIFKNRGNLIIKDIYGDEHNIVKEDIRVIFTKSMFKMWKYYKNWDEYKQKYKEYGCEFGKCNIDDMFDDSTLSYQMLQTLTDVTESELKNICNKTKTKIWRISNNIDTMQRVFGANKTNTHKNPFQKCLSIYPELLQDVYTKNTLKDIRDSLEKKAWSGKLDIYGKYTFVLPDLFAFCEYLFKNKENPKGLLDNGEVYCKLFKNEEKLDCLRSPSLYREHLIRKNVCKTNAKAVEWFKTRGVYIGVHDLASKLLQYDNDGDKLLVIGDDYFVDIAERNMQGIVPLYYEMGKAGATKLNNKSIYVGMINAFNTSNIGMPSNEITKMWNSGSPDLDLIKIQTALVNFTIDAAKTLYMPEVPESIKERLAKVNTKLPHFFLWVKGRGGVSEEKDKYGHVIKVFNNYESKLAPPNTGIVDNIQKYIPHVNIKFDTCLDKLNFRNLMRYKRIRLDLLMNKKEYPIVVEKFKGLIKGIKLVMMNEGSNSEYNNYRYVFNNVKTQMLTICDDIDLIVDILVIDLFYVRNTPSKYLFWEVFGDIVYRNLKENLENMSTLGMPCITCGKRFVPTNKNQLKCRDCRTPVGEALVFKCRKCGKEFKRDSIHQVRCEKCRTATKERDIKYYDAERKRQATRKKTQISKRVVPKKNIVNKVKT